MSLLRTYEWLGPTGVLARWFGSLHGFWLSVRGRSVSECVLHSCCKGEMFSRQLALLVGPRAVLCPY